jgi:osmotically-inducible protein OsmY
VQLKRPPAATVAGLALAVVAAAGAGSAWARASSDAGAAGRTPDSRDTAGTLAVSPSSADTVTTTRVKRALATDPRLSGSDNQVETDAGHVILRGRTSDAQQARAARELAQRQDGVRDVEDRTRTR